MGGKSGEVGKKRKGEREREWRDTSLKVAFVGSSRGKLHVGGKLSEASFIFFPHFINLKKRGPFFRGWFVELAISNGLQ